MSVSIALVRSKFKFLSVTSSSTYLLKIIFLRCSLWLVEHCTSMRVHHCVAHNDIICIKVHIWIEVKFWKVLKTLTSYLHIERRESQGGRLAREGEKGPERFDEEPRSKNLLHNSLNLILVSWRPEVLSPSRLLWILTAFFSVLQRSKLFTP